MRIRVTDIAKDFGRTGALRGVSLEIEDGELIALLGPSGSGKTTLLRVIAGLETPSTGKVFFGDTDATGVPVQRRRIGFVFQNYALFKHMSVRDNIAYGLRVLPRSEQPSSAEVQKRVQDLLDLVQLPGIGDRFPRQLSGGQQQRVALARALAVEPRVLLLDEPFGALDTKVRKDLRHWLRELHDRTGHTTVFVTHDQEEALELADRVAILNGGKLEQIGTPDEIYDSPVSPFVMSFVGDTTSIPVEFDGDHLLYEGQAFDVSLTGSYRGSGRLYLRPGDVEIVDAGAGALPGVIVNIRRTTAGHRAHIKLGVQDVMIEVAMGQSKDIRKGECVGVRILRGRVFAEQSATRTTRSPIM